MKKAMPKFAANLSMLYTELPFLDRFAAAARSGFKAVEFLFPYDFAPQEITQRLQDHQLQLVLHNMPPETGLRATGGWLHCPTASTSFAPVWPRPWTMPPL